ncbi:unnamed protein product, partial [Didymodactylos carnosus]
TVIVFEIQSQRVVETLDILIHSIIEPLMIPEQVALQLQTIHEGNKTSLKELITGNTYSTELLKDFVKEKYLIPEGMNVVMISSESFRVMQQRIERLFCLMKRRYP